MLQKRLQRIVKILRETWQFALTKIEGMIEILIARTDQASAAIYSWWVFGEKTLHGHHSNRLTLALFEVTQSWISSVGSGSSYVDLALGGSSESLGGICDNVRSVSTDDDFWKVGSFESEGLLRARFGSEKNETERLCFPNHTKWNFLRWQFELGLILKLAVWWSMTEIIFKQELK